MSSDVHSKISWNPGNASPTQHVLSSVKNVNPTLKKKEDFPVRSIDFNKNLKLVHL